MLTFHAPLTVATAQMHSLLLSNSYTYLNLFSPFLSKQKRLAANITEEQGKTLVDAEGDVLRGLRKCFYYTQ